MASLTRWTWVWVNSRSWWWTGRPGMLQFMGSQRVRHDWATELNWQCIWASCYSAHQASTRSLWELSVPITLWYESHYISKEIKQTALNWRFQSYLENSSNNCLFICAHMHSVAQSCPTLCHPTDCSLPGSLMVREGDIFGKNTEVGYHFLLKGSSWLPDLGFKPISPASPALAGRFFTTELPGKLSSNNKQMAKCQ